jgi:MYXO-CTERM domain-containing protein
MMSDRIGRLAAYGALAGVTLPASAASGGIEFDTELGLEATAAGGSVGIDFGAGFGSVFRASVTTSYYYGTFPVRGAIGSGIVFFQDQVVQFDPGNTGGWTAASLIGYAPNGFMSDPTRLALGSQIGAAGSWYPMSSGLGWQHDVAASRFTSFFSVRAGYTSTRFGDWEPDQRGFMGFRFTKDGGANYHYGWLDVEADLFGLTLTVHGWGFETEPNRPIGAGDVPAPGVAGLGLLAMGAAGVRRQRRLAG